MITQTLTIARTTMIEAIRQPVLLVMVLIGGVLQVFNTWSTGFAMGMEETGEVVGDNKLLLDLGLATIFVLGALLAAILATAVISREIENKTILTVVSKPVARPVLIFGKYLGVSVAILGAMVVMLLYLLFSLRHGVMTTVSDELDQPVLTFALGAAFLALGLGGWCNYFYNWNFAQTASLFLLPFTCIGYVAVLFLGKEWKFQPLLTDFKPQVTVACLCLMLAVMVLVAVAVAASTRLGRVMTIVLCFGIFVLSLFSNYLIGRHVFRNELLGTIQLSQPQDPEKTEFFSADSAYDIQLQLAPRQPLPPGTAFYYSPSPNGFPMLASKGYVATDRDLSNIGSLMTAGTTSSIIVTESKPPYIVLTVRNVGAPAVSILRPPAAGDYVFSRYTTVNPAALGAWGAVPNLQFYWLLDAISQNRPVSIQYLIAAVCYALVQIGAFLSLAVLLFQRRDVG